LSDLYEALNPSLSQGDIISIVPHVIIQGMRDIVGGEVPTPAWDFKDRKEKAILLTRDCHLDRPDTKWCQVCPVLPIKTIEPKNLGNLKKNKLYQYFHLPAVNEFPESFVDFSVVTTVSVDLIKPETRITTLNDDGRRSFYGQYIRWLTRWELRDISCPSCGTSFNPSQSLPVRS
jgi:hypothetical protein